MYAPEDLDRLCDVREELRAAGIQPGTVEYRQAMSRYVDSEMRDKDGEPLIVYMGASEDTPRCASAEMTAETSAVNK